MKTASKFIYALTILFLTMAFGCKKENTTTLDPNALLCNGKGTSDYLPLDSGDSWKYDDGTVSTIGAPVYHNSLAYVAFDGYELRKASNGDVIMYEPNSSSDQLFIPASPTVGQVIYHYPSSIFYGEFHVLSVNDSISTSTCKYTGLLNIELTTPNGGNLYNFYYKKGLGLVAKHVFSTRKLKEVTLK